MGHLNLSRSEKIERALALAEKERRLRECKGDSFKPWPWQIDFIEKTAQYSECAAFKANRVGGTMGLGWRVKNVTTGKYDKDYKGKRFEGPVRWLIVGVDYGQVKRGAQRILFGIGAKIKGEPQWGVGEIHNPWPLMNKEDIVDIAMNNQTRGLIETAFIRHVSGGISTVSIMVQTQEQESLMGDELHGVDFDEFPANERMYTQAIPRIETTRGSICVWATAENGANAATNRFLYERPTTPSGQELTYYRHIHKRENPTYSAEYLAEIIAKTPLHERPYRIEGKIVSGGGSIFGSILEENIKIQRNQMPDLERCKHIVGFDMGYQDWGALVWLAYDEYAKKAYYWHAEEVRYQSAYQIARVYKEVNKTYLRGWNPPVSWGWDAACVEMTSGESLLNQLRAEGVSCCSERAHNALLNDKTNSIRPGINEMWAWMDRKGIQALDCPAMANWFREREGYCWKNGKVIKKAEMRFNLMDAARYGLMMIPFARYMENSILRHRQKMPQFADTSYSTFNPEGSSQDGFHRRDVRFQ